MNVIINKVEANKMLMILSYYYTEASGTNFKYHQAIMSAWELTPPPLANFNLGRQKSLVIPIYWTYLKTTFILISEETNINILIPSYIIQVI